MKKVFTVKGEVWRWPGVGGWHFVYVDRKLNSIIEKYGRKYGSGFRKIRATVGKTSWDTALFPYKKENVFLVSIKAAVRQKEGIRTGDKVVIRVLLV